MTKCEAVKNGEVKRKGRATLEFYKEGKPQYYCYGYKDMRDEEPLTECRNCSKFFMKAQEDLDNISKEME